MRFIRSLLASVAFAAVVPTALAQDFPTKPIKLMVPFAAGGPADLQARWIGQRLSAVLGQPVVVDNKGGAGGMLGAQAVATSPADGYTLLFASVGAIAIAPYLVDKPLYDPQKDLLPVAGVATAPMVLVTAGNSNVSNLKALVERAKSSPGKSTFASAGVGTTTQLGSELLKREAGIFMVHIPYKGAAPALTDVMAGTVDVMFADAPVVLPFIKSGKLKALAVGTTARLPSLPDVPTAAEQGYRNVLASTWYGVMAPARTPPTVLNKLNGAINTVLASAEAKAFFAEQSLQVNGGSADDFGNLIRADTTRWTTLSKAIGVKME